MPNLLEKAQVDVNEQVKIVEVLDKTTLDITLNSVARVKAKFSAYEKIHGNYEKFMVDQSKLLAKKNFEDNTFKEMSVARLIAHWIIATEQFLQENELAMAGAQDHVRRGFVEKSLSAFPEEIKNQLMKELRIMKQELMERFAKKLILAQKRADRLKEKEVDRF